MIDNPYTNSAIEFNVMGEIRTSAQRTRDKIRTSLIVNKLLAHVKAENEISSTQI